jgi:hypothetical protein
VKTTGNSHKGLAAMYKMKQTFLMNEELIQVCHDDRINEHLEVKELRTLYERHNISNLRN